MATSDRRPDNPTTRSDPIALDRRASLELQAELGEERHRRVEVFDDDGDVIEADFANSVGVLERRDREAVEEGSRPSSGWGSSHWGSCRDTAGGSPRQSRTVAPAVPRSRSLISPYPAADQPFLVHAL